MASFDPKKLLKSSGLNPKDKLIQAVNKKASALTGKLSGEVATKLASAGQSLKSATAFSAAKTDALLSSAPSAFSTMAALGGGSPAIERISRSILTSGRSGGSIAFSPQDVIPRAAEEGSYSDTKIYPADLGDLEYRITFEFLEYKRPSLTEAPQTEARFSISLPIPNTLIESYGIAYSEGKYGATLGNVIASVDRGGDQSLSEGTVMGAARGAFQPNIAAAAGGLGNAVGVEAESLSGAADQLLGSIVNPHLSMFFSGVSMREHQFSWAFAPKSNADSRNLKEIYYRIKRAALPAFTPNASHTTLEYPMMVRVKIFTKGNKELYPFKMCVVPGISMNYASAGTPSFHHDGAPVICQLSMTLKEIEYFTSDDILDMQGSSFENVNEVDFLQNAGSVSDLENFFDRGVVAANALSQAVLSSSASALGLGPTPGGEE